ncbi:allophanate hydrolase [Trinickia dabaoshanensis]|uniref:Allophanate hydrolase n=1 Tax=Trinickia dabaoshanensis TaxID=564714 RepID=A0A2N7VEV4_9BURK|nr:allophanate hydrolase [Trinickia dabaoshanensis]PMS15682.1 allophanate hydrolase [Trinickia dabaoshanensis]
MNAPTPGTMPDYRSIAGLRARYASGELTPRALVDEIAAYFDAGDPQHAWIRPSTRDEMIRYADALAGRDMAALPLFGVPFAIKDNVDLAGVPTTAGCPEYAYTPSRSAPVVERLIAAGAIPIGKTNLDQFATGLSGQRSPYGACRNAYDSRYASGGSSSGSAVAVALGVAAFSLGTDTAGSGRVPAAFHGLVGLKPTKGVLSTLGVVPACRSLDCVSIFAHSPADARIVFDAARGVTTGDPYAREWQPLLNSGTSGRTAELVALDGVRFGTPRAGQLEFFGDESYRSAYEAALECLRRAGAHVVELDFSAHFAAARLLYEGPWVAERLAALRDFFDRNPGAVHPTVREIVGGGARFSAADTFAAFDRLASLRVEAERVWDSVDALVTPTSATTATIDELNADPIGVNARFGYYTNFVNLLDLSAIAVPAGVCGPGRHAGLPFGITFIGRAHDDAKLLGLAQAWAGESHAAPSAFEARPVVPAFGGVRVAVVGAHLTGEPLNWQLTQRGARRVATTTTAPAYRLYALDPGATGGIEKPGLVRVREHGEPIDIEVWEIPVAAYGGFVAGIDAPLGIGTVTIADGSRVQGFLCEHAALAEARDITRFGGWRAYRASGMGYSVRDNGES